MSASASGSRENSVGVRERLNQNRVMAAALAGAVILGVAAVVTWRVWPSAAAIAASSGSTGKAFFSVDDGQTWFAADASNIPPFQHDGKTAYRVRVFQVAGGGKPFVSHLERFSPEEKQRIEDLMKRAAGNGQPPDVFGVALVQRMEVKRPGDSRWVRWTPQTSEQFKQTIQPRAPDGTSAGLQPVLPD